ncbi:MAG: DUF1365 family protein [Alphaproteobacteria bacterium]|nr:DUF1365 family protein [Alphaproteobacteria bacterium]
MTRRSRLYVGHVMHRRLRPRRHALRYRCFWTLIDLDELPALGRSLRLFGYNRLAPISFHASDHGDGRPDNLRGYVDARLSDAGIDIGSGAVRLLCMPRVAGYAFNPLSIFFCYGQDAALRAILWEVNNTFGERHSYLIEAAANSSGLVEQECAKEFFVSPFLDQPLTYAFRVSGPGDDVSVVINTNDEQGLLLVAALSGKAREMTDSNLLGILVRQPFVTLKVTAAIHWEALKLWLKGIDLRHKPPPPRQSVTVVRPSPAIACTPVMSSNERATPAECQTTQ